MFFTNVHKLLKPLISNLQIEQHVLDTNAGKQLSQTATDVFFGKPIFPVFTSSPAYQIPLDMI
jgi:hypothetical protein